MWPPRSRTPPPLRAVAMPLDQQMLDPDSEYSQDLVKCQFKCTYATQFGQELRLVGGAPELGAWDVTQVRRCGVGMTFTQLLNSCTQPVEPLSCFFNLSYTTCQKHAHISHSF